MISYVKAIKERDDRRKKRAPIEGAGRAGAIFRLSTFGIAIILAYMGLHEPRSLSYFMMQSTEGSFLVYFLAFVGCAGILDVVVNDFLPIRFQWKWGKRQRHFILIALAFCYVAQLYVAYPSISSPSVLLFYLFNTFTILLTTFIDAKQRNEDASCLLILK